MHPCANQECLDCPAVRKPANPATHEATTAEEIWTDSGGDVDIVGGGVGTGGRLTGIARVLKPRKPGLRIIGVEPLESAVLSGHTPARIVLKELARGSRRFVTPGENPRIDGAGRLILASRRDHADRVVGMTVAR